MHKDALTPLVFIYLLIAILCFKETLCHPICSASPFAFSLSSYLVLAGSQPPLSDIYGSTMAGYWCVWKINGNGRRKGNCPFASSPRKIELSRLSRLCVSIIHSSDLYWPLIEVFMVLLWYHLVEIDSFVLLCRLFAVFCCHLTIPVWPLTHGHNVHQSGWTQRLNVALSLASMSRNEPTVSHIHCTANP